MRFESLGTYFLMEDEEQKEFLQQLTGPARRAYRVLLREYATQHRVQYPERWRCKPAKCLPTGS
jgi:hypothetical protein